MKKGFLKSSIFAIIVISFLSLGFLTACDDKDLDNRGQTKTIINEIATDDYTKNVLDSVFSDYNSIVRGIEGDTLFYLINNNQELQSMANNVDLDIDFENNCIIWGRFISPITSGTILSNNLYYDSQNLIYNYIVNIYIPSSGYTARKGLYFWGIYPKPNHNVIFTLNSNNK
ncbi:MAG: hypothetical protein EOM29_01095 [Bacteroidia bacterium]|nr:hypothetical protein [Bacteroidia bacterium]